MSVVDKMVMTDHASCCSVALVKGSHHRGGDTAVIERWEGVELTISFDATGELAFFSGDDVYFFGGLEDNSEYHV